MEALESTTHHYGFVPQVLITEIINSINALLYKTLASLPQTDPLQMAKIETLFEHAVDYHFDKFEVYCLSNVFCGRDQSIVDTASILKKSERIKEMKQKIIATKYYLHRLKCEIERQDKRMEVLKGISDIGVDIDGLIASVVKLRENAASVKGVDVAPIAEVDERFVVPGKGFVGFAGDFAQAARIGKLEGNPIQNI